LESNERATRPLNANYSSSRSLIGPQAPLALSLPVPPLSFEARLDRSTGHSSPLSGLRNGEGAPDQVPEPRLGALAILPLASRVARHHPDGAFIAQPGA
jgi:hypothetical protein